MEDPGYGTGWVGDRLQSINGERQRQREELEKTMAQLIDSDHRQMIHTTSSSLFEVVVEGDLCFGEGRRPDILARNSIHVVH